MSASRLQHPSTPTHAGHRSAHQTAAAAAETDSLPPVGRPPVLVVLPWHDPVVERVGHRADSAYVEMFWLGILGPTATWLFRRLNAGLDEHPAGFEIDLPDTARSLGISYADHPSNPFVKALQRCVMFGLAQPCGTAGTTVAVRRRVPALSRRHLARLPQPLQDAHPEWQRATM